MPGCLEPANSLMISRLFSACARDNHKLRRDFLDDILHTFDELGSIL